MSFFIHRFPRTVICKPAASLCLMVSLERFQPRETEYGVEAFAINRHGAVLSDVRGSRQIVVLVALVAFERSKFNAIEVAFHDLLSKARVVAARHDNVHIRTIGRREIAQAQILLAIGAFVDRRASAGRVRYSFEASGINRLGIQGRSKRGGFVYLLIDPKL